MQPESGSEGNEYARARHRVPVLAGEQRGEARWLAWGPVREKVMQAQKWVWVRAEFAEEELARAKTQVQEEEWVPEKLARAKEELVRAQEKLARAHEEWEQKQVWGQEEEEEVELAWAQKVEEEEWAWAQAWAQEELAQEELARAKAAKAQAQEEEWVQEKLARAKEELVRAQEELARAHEEWAQRWGWEQEEDEEESMAAEKENLEENLELAWDEWMMEWEEAREWVETEVEAQAEVRARAPAKAQAAARAEALARALAQARAGLVDKIPPLVDEIPLLVWLAEQRLTPSLPQAVQSHPPTYAEEVLADLKIKDILDSIKPKCRQELARHLWGHSKHWWLIQIVTPVTRLPLELLQSILYPIINEASGPPLMLMLVCKHWYTAVTGIWAHKNANGRRDRQVGKASTASRCSGGYGDRPW